MFTSISKILLYSVYCIFFIVEFKLHSKVNFLFHKNVFIKALQQVNFCFTNCQRETEYFPQIVDDAYIKGIFLIISYHFIATGRYSSDKIFYSKTCCYDIGEMSIQHMM